MSPWLADQLHITLSPTQIGVVRVRQSLGMRGIKRQVVASETLACEVDANAFGWEKSLQAMDALLARHSQNHPVVTLVLSNHFVHYVLVPWSDLISSDEQQHAYNRHCLNNTYGENSANWEIRQSRVNVGSAHLAGAIDEKLLAACNEVVERHGLRITSIQPYLMNVFNQLKNNMQETDAWFALVETGNICLAHFQQGNWVHFRSARLAGEWEDFARFLTRESFMAESENPSDEKPLYLYAPHFAQLDAINGWKIHALPHPLFSSLAENDLASNNAGLAMAGSDTVNG